MKKVSIYGVYTLTTIKGCL